MSLKCAQYETSAVDFATFVARGISVRSVVSILAFRCGWHSGCCLLVAAHPFGNTRKKPSVRSSMPFFTSHGGLDSTEASPSHASSSAGRLNSRFFPPSRRLSHQVTYAVALQCTKDHSNITATVLPNTFERCLFVASRSG